MHLPLATTIQQHTFSFTDTNTETHTNTHSKLSLIHLLSNKQSEGNAAKPKCVCARVYVCVCVCVCVLVHVCVCVCSGDSVKHIKTYLQWLVLLYNWQWGGDRRLLKQTQQHKSSLAEIHVGFVQSQLFSVNHSSLFKSLVKVVLLKCKKSRDDFLVV